MKLAITIELAAMAMLPAIPVVDPYQDAIDGLMQASHRHMELTYVCREITGLSRYRDALAAAENAVRATGMSAEAAMSVVAEMAWDIETTSSRQPPPGLNDCTTGVVRTKQELLRWWARLHRAQQ